MCAPYLNFCHELKDVAKLTRCVSREQFAASQHYGIVCGFHILGAVHILCQPPEGGEGVWQMRTIADEGGRGGKPKADHC